MKNVIPFLREKVRSGTVDARVKFCAKKAEDEGVAHGPTVDQDLNGDEYKTQNVHDAIDRGFDATQQYFADPSSMTQPGMLHGTINYLNNGGYFGAQQVSAPLISSPNTQ
jgi:hypothetical protein